MKVLGPISQISVTNGCWMIRKRRRRADPAIIDAIDLMVAREPRPTAAAIRRELLDEFPGSKVPSDKTVYEIARELTPVDPSGLWTLGSAEPDDIALVMPVLSLVVGQTTGRRTHLTHAEATWITRVRRAAADLPLEVVYQTARVYMSREAHSEETTDIDMFLSWGAWRNEDAANQYFSAVFDGWVGAPPQFLEKAIPPGYVITRGLRTSWTGRMNPLEDEFEYPPAAPHRSRPTADQIKWLASLGVDVDVDGRLKRNSDKESDQETTRVRPKPVGRRSSQRQEPGSPIAGEGDAPK